MTTFLAILGVTAFVLFLVIGVPVLCDRLFNGGEPGD